MKHLLLIAVLAALAACASSEPQPTDSSAGLAIGHDLTCDADDVVRNGEQSTLYISLLVPDGGGDGRFCIGSGCEDAQFEPVQTRALGWTAIMRTNDRTNYNAELEVARDLRSFTLRQAGSDGASTWTGICNAAGS